MGSSGVPRLPSPEKFRRNVERLVERCGLSKGMYERCIDDFAGVEISQLDDNHRTRIMEPFLLTWGRMGRVLGRKGVDVICKKLKAVHKKIEPLRKENLLTVDLHRIRALVIALYDDIRNTRFTSKGGKRKKIGPTATSKVLHLTCPALFIMWDSAIRNGYRKRSGDGKDYFLFLIEMRDMWKKLEEMIDDLQQEYGVRPTRLIDQYNWIEFSKRTRQRRP